MENLHLKNLDLSKVKKQVQENKIKSIVEKKHFQNHRFDG